jgi:hypothetical protein
MALELLISSNLLGTFHSSFNNSHFISSLPDSRLPSLLLSFRLSPLSRLSFSSPRLSQLSHRSSGTCSPIGDTVAVQLPRFVATYEPEQKQKTKKTIQTILIIVMFFASGGIFPFRNMGQPDLLRPPDLICAPSARRSIPILLPGDMFLLYQHHHCDCHGHCNSEVWLFFFH